MSGYVTVGHQVQMSRKRAGGIVVSDSEILTEVFGPRRAKLEITNGHKHDHGDHVHDERMEIEQKAVDAEGDDAERSRLTKALVKVRPS